jgi:signal transduction histidine kinase
METTARNLLHDPAIRAVVINEREITAGKRADAALLATLECGEAMIRATSEPELLESICAAIVKMGGYRMAWVGFPDPSGEKNIIPVARAGAGQDYVDKARISWATDEPRGQGPLGRAIRIRKPVVTRDIAHDPRFAPWRTEALRRGYASIIALPLLWRSECIGSLAIYSDQSFAFQKEETLLLQNLAGDIAYGLTALRTRAAHDRLQRELLDISEREQRRIAQDLHDGLCQQLVGASYLASALHRRLALRNDPDAASLESLAQTLRTSATDARALSHCVHPVGPAPDALPKALANFAQVTSSMFSITCRFISPRPVRVHQECAANLYRIAQEATSNAIKHGQATRVTIRLTRIARGGILLSIRDNGAGIPPRPSPGSGMGLQIMRHRASTCGGTLAIRKASPRGTAVSCRIPPSQAPGKKRGALGARVEPKVAN